MKRFRLLLLLTFMFVLTFACGPVQPSTTLQTTPQPVSTEEGLTQLAETPVPTAAVSTEPVQASGPWAEYRDPRYGYAIALPCYWTYTPTPLEGMFAAMTARSYSEEFFGAHAERGNWKDGIWPEGALKMDVFVYEGVNPSLNLREAVEQFYEDYASEQEITSIEEVMFSSHPAVIATVAGGLAGAEPPARLVYMRLAPDKLLWFLIHPNHLLDSTDVQTIINSLVLSPEEDLVLPALDPSGRPEDGSLACS